MILVGVALAAASFIPDLQPIIGGPLTKLMGCASASDLQASRGQDPKTVT